MNTYKRKKRLIDELKEKDYRDAYTASGVDVGIAFQIKALREQRKWNQTRLAEEADMKQERISVLENPSRSPSLSTLKKLANAFDVGLMVRFVPISELVEHELNLSSDSLNIFSFNEDPYFQVNEEEVDNPTDLKQYAGISTQGTSSGVVIMKDYIAKKVDLSLPNNIPIAIASNEQFII